MEKILDKAKNANIVVLGDFMIDHYRYLKPQKISPEAPVIIFEEERNELFYGGAGNVYKNLIALETNPKLISIVGCQFDAKYEEILLNDENCYFLTEGDKKLTIKERIVTNRQQIVRIDHQTIKPVLNDTVNLIFNWYNIIQYLKSAEAIIISDYNHGFCTPYCIEKIRSLSNCPIIVDTKSPDAITKYYGVDVIIPNIDEAKLISGLNDSPENIAIYLKEKMNLKCSAITLGAQGIITVSDEGCNIIPALDINNTEVVDVTGAGDTVAACFAVGIAAKASWVDIMQLAMNAAGLKIKKRGVATISSSELKEMNHENGAVRKENRTA